MLCFLIFLLSYRREERKRKKERGVFCVIKEWRRNSEVSPCDITLTHIIIYTELLSKPLILLGKLEKRGSLFCSPVAIEANYTNTIIHQSWILIRVADIKRSLMQHLSCLNYHHHHHPRYRFLPLLLCMWRSSGGGGRNSSRTVVRDDDI